MGIGLGRSASGASARPRSGPLALDDPAILQTYVERFRIVFRTRLVSVLLVGLATAACGLALLAVQYLALHLTLLLTYSWVVERAGRRPGDPATARSLRLRSTALSFLMACHAVWLPLYVNAVLPGFHAEAVILLVALFVLNGLQVHLTLTSFLLSVAPPLVGLILIGIPREGSMVAHLWGGGIFVVAILSAAWRQQLSDRQSAEASAALSRRNVELVRAAAQADAANRAKSDFLANMSHEIRTPMNGVVAVADLLARADLPPAEKDMVEVVRTSADTLQRLLADVLDLARVESGKIVLESAPFHLGELVRATAALTGLKCDEKGVRLSVAVAPELDRMVAGDPVRVRQVLTNLMSNAAKFTDAGEIVVAVEPAAEGVARFTVTDTGPGFDPALRAQLLSRFEQADNSITRRYGGTGLGLAISKQLVELMGGVLDCDGRPGEGAVFWFEVPLPPCEVEAADAAPTESAPPQGLRVLVADDHPTNRKVVELMLAEIAELTSVENGAEAVAAFRDRPFDLVLMDMQMPVMDGLAAVREMRRLEAAAGAARTPVIMLTANAMPEHVAAAAAAGADRHLAKPITAPVLFEAVGLVLDARPGADEAAA